METHWKNLTDTVYIGVGDFKQNEQKTLTIKKVVSEKIPPNNVRKDVLYFENFDKPFVCNATNCKTITKLLKTPIIEHWVGKSIILYADMSVRSPGQRRDEIPDGGVRVYQKLPEQKPTAKAQPKQTAKQTVKCAVCGEEIKPVEIGGKTYSVEQILKSTGDKCYECWLRERKAQEEENGKETDDKEA